jgi:hypothetical protein
MVAQGPTHLIFKVLSTLAVFVIASPSVLGPEDCACVVISNGANSTDPQWAEKFYQENNLEWEDLSDERRLEFESMGWTKEKWSKESFDSKFWSDLTTEELEAVIALGWTEEEWNDEDPDEPACYGKSWWNLSPEERKAAEFLGFSENKWYTKPAVENFKPIIIPLSVPELEKMNLDYLETLDVLVSVVDGSIVTDDELVDRYHLPMSQYIKRLRTGSMLYLKYEDQEVFKKHISSIIGSKVLKYLMDALRNSPLREMGYYLDFFDQIQLLDYHYSFFVGGKNTTTPMHYDSDDFNFLWLVEGRKRVILIPNDERTVGKYDCLDNFFEGHSCWTGIDVLNGPLPEHAIEFEMKPGDGLLIPDKMWHAVKNLEPSVAYGIRIDSSMYVFDA